MQSDSSPRAGLLITIVLAGLAMIGPFAIDTIFPAFTQIGEGFKVDATAMQQVTSMYMLAFAVMSLFHGPLSDALGRKPVIIAGLTGFVVANVIAALSPNLTVLLVARFIQGGFAGAATIISRVVIRDMFSGAQAQKLMSQVMMIFSIAPAIAPIIGGWLLTVGKWPLVFWAVGGYGLLLIVSVALLLPETQPRERRTPLRVRAVVSAVFEVGTRPEMIRLALTMSLGFGAYFVYIAGAPIIVVDLLGQGERDFWKLFVPLITGTMIGSFISGQVAERVDRYRLITIIMPTTVVAGALNVAFMIYLPFLPWAVLAPSLLAVAVGVAFPVLNLEILDLFPDHRGAAASMGTFASLIFNAALAGVIVPFVASSLLNVALLGLGFSVLSMGGWIWHVKSRQTFEPTED